MRFKYDINSDVRYVFSLIYFELFFALLVSGSVYLVLFLPVLKSAKCIDITGSENTIDDIPLNPTIPKSGIYCGSKAFFKENHLRRSLIPRLRGLICK